MRFAWGVLFILLLVLLAGCAQPAPAPAPQPSPQPAPEPAPAPKPEPSPAPEPDFSCATPADCEAKDLVHIMCVGQWACLEGRCAFQCSAESPLEQPEPEPAPIAEPAPAAPKVVEISMVARQWSFEPNRIEVNQGDTVRLTVTSQDVPHGLSIPAFGVSRALNPGETETVEFVASKAGTFSFSCNVPCGTGHGQMGGMLVVRKAP